MLAALEENVMRQISPVSTLQDVPLDRLWIVLESRQPASGTFPHLKMERAWTSLRLLANPSVSFCLHQNKLVSTLKVRDKTRNGVEAYGELQAATFPGHVKQGYARMVPAQPSLVPLVR